MSADGAQLQLTRTRPISNISYSVVVKIDGKFVTKLGHGDTVTVPVSLGPHTVRASLFHWRSRPLQIDVRRPGTKYIDVALPSIFAAHRAVWRPFTAIRLTPHPALVGDGAKRARPRGANAKSGLRDWAAKVERHKATPSVTDSD